MTAETSNARGEVVAWEARDPDDGTRWVTRHASERDGWMGLGRTIRPLIYGDAPPPAAARGDVRIIARDIHYAIMDDGLAPLSNADNHKVREAILRVLQAALAAEGVQAGEVEQRARELLAAEYQKRGHGRESAEARASYIERHECAVFDAIVAALSQQPEARGVVDAPSVDDLSRDAMAALLRSEKVYAKWSDLAADALAVAQSMRTALTGERNG